MSGYSFRLCSLVFERKVFPFLRSTRKRQMLTLDETQCVKISKNVSFDNTTYLYPFLHANIIAVHPLISLGFTSMIWLEAENETF